MMALFVLGVLEAHHVLELAHDVLELPHDVLELAHDVLELVHDVLELLVHDVLELLVHDVQELLVHAQGVLEVLAQEVELPLDALGLLLHQVHPKEAPVPRVCSKKALGPPPSRRGSPRAGLVHLGSLCDV